MTWFDFVIIGTLGLSTLFAAGRGFIREAIALITLAVAFVAAIYLSQPLGALVDADANTLRKLIVFSVIFIAIFIMTLLVTEGMRAKFLGRKIGRYDRLAGALFGFLRGFLLIGGLYIVIDYYATDGEEPDGFKNAATLGIAEASANMLESIGFDSLPTDYQPGQSQSNQDGA